MSKAPSSARRMSSGDESDSSGCLGLLFEKSDSDAEEEQAAPEDDLSEIPVVVLSVGESSRGQCVRLDSGGAEEISVQKHRTALLRAITMSGLGTKIYLAQLNHDGLEGTGGVAWGAAPALCTLLATPSSPIIPDGNVHYGAADFANKVVVELGSGTGAVGLFIAARWPSAKVILTDFAEAQEQLRRNITANGLDGRCVAAELPFGESVPDCLARVANDALINPRGPFQLEPGRQADIIIASDCTYSYLAEFIWQPLARTIISGLKMKNTSATPPRVSTEVWIAHQERHGARGYKLQEFLVHLAEVASRKTLKMCTVGANDASKAATLPSISPTSCPALDQIAARGHFIELHHPCISEPGEEYPLRVFHLMVP